MPPTKKKISQLPAAEPLNGTELIEVVQGGVNKKAILVLSGGTFPNPLTDNVIIDLNGFFLNFVDVPGTLSLEISPGSNLIQLLSGLASGLRLDGAIGRTTLGDSGGQGNGTTIVIEDTAGTIVANIGGVEHNLIPAVKVLGVNYTTVGNVGTTDTELHSYTLDGKLNNDGESIFGEFFGNTSVVGFPQAVQQIKFSFLNNGNVFDNVFDFSQNGASQAWVIKPYIIRVSNTVVKIGVTGWSGGQNDRTPNFIEITSLNLSLPLTIRILGQSTGTGAASNQIKSQFSKIFWSAAV